MAQKNNTLLHVMDMHSMVYVIACSLSTMLTDCVKMALVIIRV